MPSTPLTITRPTVASIRLDHLEYNLGLIRHHTQYRPLMAVVKANAYGHGLIPMAQAFERFGVESLGVAFLEEGIALRQAGLQIPILVLGGIFDQQIESFLAFDLELAVSSLGKLKQVEEVASLRKKTAKIHLKIDTGMGRIGVRPQSALGLIEGALRSKHCSIQGIYSHLACADIPGHPKTQEQLESFETVTQHFNRLGEPMPVRHLANSGGVLYSPDTYLDMVRPGILLYGVYPHTLDARPLPVKPVLSLASRVVYFKVLLPHHSVSYGCTWESSELTRIVTIPIGYGDGYPRTLSNRGRVMIRGNRYPIVGTICMDQLMVNIGWDSAYNGDEVVLIGNQGDSVISVEVLAEESNTIPYTILTGLNDRIPRIYLQGSS